MKIVSVDPAAKKVRYAKYTFTDTRMPAFQQDAWLFAVAEEEKRLLNLSLHDTSLRTYSYQKEIVDFSEDEGSITVLLPNELRVINRWNEKERRVSEKADRVQIVNNSFYLITDKGLQKMQIK